MTTISLLLVLTAGQPPLTAVADSPATAKPEVRAVRLPQPIAIDGQLSEAAWRSAQRIVGFTQRDPTEGAAATESTVVFVAYDDAAVYVAARLFDSAPDSIVARLGRRDVHTSSDMFTVYLDSYHDRRSGFYFALDAAGTLHDGILYNDDWDDNSWDGVWEGRVRTDETGWTAELRIPYSQLRFVKADTYTWGVNFKRTIARKNEIDYLVLRPKNASGFVSRFADLVGIANITPPRRLEIMPYVTTRAAFTQQAVGNPFNDGSSYTPGAGADLRFGIGSNLTVNATVNPDFGQVEVDPAVVNLSDVETFFGERRPFFIEGSSIFNFGFGGASNYWGFNWPGPDLLHTRRMGRSPQGSTPDADYTDRSDGANILGALKLTGKVAGRWNLGTLAAVTAREYARLDTAGFTFRKEIEPLTYYGVVRVQREFPDGRQGLGTMVTTAVRGFADPTLADEISRDAFVGGLDGWTFLDQDKEWVVTGWVAASRVSGTAARITALQLNPVHYFQRPDAQQTSVDPTATSLAGWAARFHLNKQKGDWFSNSGLGFISPGFETNDLGFMGRTGVINMHAGGGHAWRKPGKLLRQAEVGGALFQSYNWDGDVTWRGVFNFGWLQFLNYWSINWDLAYNPYTVSDRRTRGGPLTLNLPGTQLGFNINSDSRKSVTFSMYTGLYHQRHDYSDRWAGANIQYRPMPNVSLSVGPNFSWGKSPAQYIGTYDDTLGLAAATYDRRYVFADLDQTEVSAGIRLNYTFSPTLSLQVYAQPLVSAGSYDRFKELARPRTFDFNVYGAGTSTFDDTTYVADPDGPGGPADPIQLYRPDFNFKSLRGNAVLRWEYLPGSTLFLVWTQSRSHFDDSGEFAFGRSMSRLWDAGADNIFMVKATYWWNP